MGKYLPLFEEDPCFNFSPKRIPSPSSETKQSTILLIKILGTRRYRKKIVPKRRWIFINWEENTSQNTRLFTLDNSQLRNKSVSTYFLFNVTESWHHQIASYGGIYVEWKYYPSHSYILHHMKVSIQLHPPATLLLERNIRMYSMGGGMSLQSGSRRLEYSKPSHFYFFWIFFKYITNIAGSMCLLHKELFSRSMSSKTQTERRNSSWTAWPLKTGPMICPVNC